MANIAEEAVSKGMGKLKRGKAIVQGLTGVFQTLAEEHGEAAALLQRGLTTDDMDKLKSDIFPELRKELLSHERGELEVVYPELEQHAELRAVAREHARDAGELERLIRELTDGNLTDDDWKSTFRRLADTVEGHVEREEGQYFPQAQRVIGEEAAENLIEGYSRRKRATMEELS